MKRIIAILILVLLSNCQKKENDLEFEKKIMNEIFIDVVDSIFKDIRTTIIPIKPSIEKGISDSLRKQKQEKYEIILAQREKRLIEIKNDTSRIVLAIYDTIYTESLLKGRELIKYNNIEYLFDSITKKIEYKIDLSKIKKSDKYIFKYWSKFPKGRDLWRTKYPFYLGGVIKFSRIQFDKNKNFGVLIGGVSYGILNGAGYRIFIKKDINNRWMIEKIIGTSIS